MQIKPKLIIWGAGGHAKVVADIVRLQNQYEIVGFLDDTNPDRWNRPFCNGKILGGQNELAAAKAAGVSHIVIAIGDCAARMKLAKIAVSGGFELANAIHPQTIIASDVSIGCGSVVVAGAIINPAATVGKHAIINTSATIDHDCIIEDGVHISPGANLGGGVHVQSGAWIAIGAKILPGIIIGKGSIIGAGSVVTKNIPDNVIAYGVPARIVRSVV